MIAGPLLFLILPLAMAGIVYILLRWSSLSALLAIGTALVLGIAVITLPLDQAVRFWGERQIAMGETVTLLGRELVFEPADRAAMAFLFFTAAGIFLLTWPVDPHSLLFPMGLAMLSLLSGALLIRPFIYAVLLIGISAALSVFALQGERRLPTRGGLRYLTFAMLALPGVLVTHWLLDRYALTPNDTSLISMATTLLAISFAMLLGVVPFHIWVPAVAGDSVPMAGAFVLTVGNGAVWFLLLDFLEAYPWLSGHPRFGSLVFAAGLTMVVVGGLLALAQRRLGPLMGYGALVDTGGALIALAMGSSLGVTLVLLSLLVRPFGLGLMALGLSGLRARSDDDDSVDALRGLGWKATWSTAALILGGLSVAGLPVSAGFVWHWAFCRTLAPFGPGSALFLLLAGAGVLVGVWRAMFALLERPRSSDDSETFPTTPEGWLMAAVVVVAIVACVGVGLFPQVLAPFAARLAGTYTFFSP